MTSARGTAIAQMTTTGAVTTFIIDQSGAESPSQITAGPDGGLWFTDATGIGRISTNGAFTHFGLSSPTIGIAAGPDGNIWFTTAGSIGHITTGMSGLALFSTTLSGATSPQITSGPAGSGALWFTGPKSAIGKVTTAGVITTIPITAPTIGLGPITLGSDGAIWFGGKDAIGRVTTAGAATSTAFAGSESGISAGPDGAIWFTDLITVGITSEAGVGRLSTGSSNSGAPTISQITPSSIVVNSPQTTLQIFGTNLLGIAKSPCTDPAQSVTFGGTLVNVTPVSAGELDVTIPANLLTQAVQIPVVVSVKQIGATGGCQTLTASGSVQITSSSSGGGGGTGNPVNVSTATLFFNSIAGKLPTPETFSITSSSGSLNYGITINYPSSPVGAAPLNFLNVSSSSGLVQQGTPVGITVTVNSQALLQLGTGKFTANIVVSASSSGSAVPGTPIPHAGSGSQTVTVTLTVSPTGLTVQTLLVFGALIGGPSPQDPQSLPVLGSAIPFTYSIQYETASSAGATCSSSSIMTTTVTTAQWLSVSGNGSGVGGQSLSLAVSPAGLTAGTYRADLNIVAQGVTYDVAIYLVVRGGPTSTIPFTYTVGGTLPPAQSFTVASGCTPPSGFTSTVQIAVSSDLSWLNVTPPSTNAGASYSVSANPVGLQTGTYFGTVVLTDFAGDVSVASVVLTVTSGTGPITSALPHFAAQDVWTTGIFVINTSNTKSASYTVAFYDDNGNPEPLPFSSGTTKSLTGTLPALGSAYYEASNPAAPVIAGWGQITSDPSIVIQALFRENSNGTYYEAAVPSNSGSQEFEIPFDATIFTATGDQFFTGFAIANLDPLSPATIICTARDQTGAVIPNVFSGLTGPPAMIAGFGHWAGFNFPALIGLRGTIDCSSTTNVAATALRFMGTKAFSSLPVIDKGLAATPSGTALPQFAAQDVWTTGIFAINTSATPANFSITFHQDSGAQEPVPFSTGTSATLGQITLPANGSGYYETINPAGTLLSGWGHITADPAIVIQALFRENSSGTFFEAAVPSNVGSKEFIIPFDATMFAATGQPFLTGLAIANLDAANAANVTCVARDGTGAVIPNAFTVATGPPQLPASGHWSGFNFPALTGKRGTIDCTSNTTIAATALHFIGNTAFSSLPVVYK